MKTPVSLTWIPGLILVMAWLPVGFAQNSTTPSTPPASVAGSAVAPTSDTAAPVSPAIAAPEDFPSIPLPESGALVVKRQPPKVRLSPWTGEIVKLAESGVEDRVILSFIENSGTFNLGADQIVYLNDLGLSGEIINAMLQHDRDLISGARPLSITSEPDWQTAFDSILALNSAVLAKPISQTTTIAPLPSPTPTEQVQKPTPGSFPDVDRAVPTQLAVIQRAMADEIAPARTAAFSPQRQAGKKSGPYRVREPYPEEITAPIILIYGESRIPNTVVVVGFPRSTP